MLDLQELRDLHEIRFHIEYGMVDQVIEWVSAEQMAKLHDILERIREKAENSENTLEHDHDFHMVLWENVPNSVLSKILEVFWAIFREMCQHIELSSPSKYVYRRHADLLDALEKGDAELMRQGIVHHFKDMHKRWTLRIEGPKKPVDEHLGV
jgi:DNA-binding FadR family transcriptional regulator